MTGTTIEIKKSNLICEPGTGVSNVLEQLSDVVVKDSNGKKVTTGNIGTGYTIEYEGKKYTVVKMGDVNGDGKVNTIDALNALRYDVDIVSLNKYEVTALDLNGDGKSDTLDALILLRYDVGLENIKI